MLFAYDDSLVAEFPTIRAAVIDVTGLSNGPSGAAFADEFRAEQAAVADALTRAAIADLPSIAAWRRTFSRFGAKPTQYRNAAEALLRRLTKQGDLPGINALVDLGNLLSIRYAMPVAVIDRAGIRGGVTVRTATGHEPFSDLGSTGDTTPVPGEVVFVDEAGVAAARRWCWRQSAQSAVGASTVDALIVVEGHHDTAEADVAAAADDAEALLATHQPDAVSRSWLLSPARRSAG